MSELSTHHTNPETTRQTSEAILRLERKVPKSCPLEGHKDRPDICVNNPWRFPENHEIRYCRSCPSDPSMPSQAETKLLFDQAAEEDIPQDIIRLYFPFKEDDTAVEEFKDRRIKQLGTHAAPLRSFVLAIAVLPDIYREAFVKRALGIDQRQKLDLSRINKAVQDFRTINPPLDDLMIDSRQEIKS